MLENLEREGKKADKLKVIVTLLDVKCVPSIMPHLQPRVLLSSMSSAVTGGPEAKKVLELRVDPTTPHLVWP